MCVDNTCVNIFDKKPIDDYVFLIEELKKKDLTPIIVNMDDISKHFREANTNHEAFIEILEKNFSKKIKFCLIFFLNILGIPNNNVEKKYNFTDLESNLKIKAAAENVDEE